MRAGTFYSDKKHDQHCCESLSFRRTLPPRLTWPLANSAGWMATRVHSSQHPFTSCVRESQISTTDRCQGNRCMRTVHATRQLRHIQRPIVLTLPTSSHQELDNRDNKPFINSGVRRFVICPFLSMSDEDPHVATEGDRCDRDKMYTMFQSWALHNYGDSGKTKTLTVRKYERVVDILTGDESTSTDNSKFRFWVKAKGFRLGSSINATEATSDGRAVLYVPCKNSVSLHSQTGTCTSFRQ